jgi:hypothetical protein
MLKFEPHIQLRQAPGDSAIEQRTRPRPRLAQYPRLACQIFQADFGAARQTMVRSAEHHHFIVTPRQSLDFRIETLTLDQTDVDIEATHTVDDLRGVRHLELDARLRPTRARFSRTTKFPKPEILIF